jgi:hypothetical protein
LLEVLDGSCLVTIVGNGCLGALLERTKIEFLELNGKLVDLDFVFGWLWEADSDLNRNDVSEWVAFWSLDSEVDVPDLGFVSNNILSDGEWDSNLDSLLSLDFFSDWNIDNINWKAREVLFVVKRKGASTFPWPESII